MVGTSCRGLLWHMLANRALIYPNQVEVIVLKAELQWGSNISVINNPLGEPGHTLLFAGLLSTWSCVYSDHMFFPCFMGELLNRGLLRDTNE